MWRFQIDISPEYFYFSFPAGSHSLCVRPWGPQEARVYTRGTTLGPGRGLWRLLWGFEVAKTASKYIRTGYFSAEPEPARKTQTPQLIWYIFDIFDIFAYFVAASSRCPSSSRALYTAVATARQQSYIRLFSLWPRWVVLLRVRVRVYAIFPAFLGDRTEHIISLCYKIPTH